MINFDPVFYYKLYPDLETQYTYYLVTVETTYSE
jgi:hypothetical protein